MTEIREQPEINLTKYYLWEEYEGIVGQYGGKAYSTIAGFEIKVVPKFTASGGERDNSYYENLIKQKSFLDTFFSVFIDAEKSLNCSMELRFVSNPIEKQIRCYVLLKLLCVDIERDVERLYVHFDNLKEEFERIFPKDYLIQEVSQVDLAGILHYDKVNSVVEIIKAPKMLTTGKVAESDNAEIATIYSDDLSGEIRYNVPCCSYLEPKAYNFFNFYQLLQDVNYEAHIRIAIGAAQVFESERSIAMHYQNMILRSYGQSLTPEVANYLRSFAKYLSANQLFSLKIQVMSAFSSQAMEIANSFCSQLSFGEINTTSHLKCFSLETKDASVLASDWEGCNHYFYSLVDQKYESDDPEIVSFVKRQNYLCDTAEVMALFRLPTSDEKGLPGFYTQPVRPFFQPSFRKEVVDSERIYLGNIEKSIGDKKPLPFSIPVEDLVKHGLIVGSTGSGKTNTTLSFVRSLIEKNIPFLIIEPVKSEYYQELSEYAASRKIKINKFNFKNPYNKDGKCNPEFLRFNPMFPVDSTSARTNPGSEISILQHISLIKGCFNAAFPMYGIMPMILEQCLYDLYYRSFDSDENALFNPETSPKHFFSKPYKQLDDNEQYLYDNLNIRGLLNEIDEHLTDEMAYSSQDRSDIGNPLRRRIAKLTRGVLGHCLCPHLWVDKNEQKSLIENNIAKILTEPTIIELEHLGDNDEKALVMAFLLTYIFELRLTEKSTQQLQKEQGSKFSHNKNTHVAIIEEAHRLLSNSGVSSTGGEDGPATEDSKSKSISLFIDMLAEIRSKGQSIFIVEQIPTKLVSDAIKNTNLKIMHRVTSQDDRNYLGSAMNMNEQQKNYVPTLKKGEAIIFSEQLDNPVFIKVDKF